MPVPVPELGSYNYVQETKVRARRLLLRTTRSDPCARRVGKPRLGGPGHDRPQRVRHARGQQEARAGAHPGCARGRLLLREELQHLPGAREPPVRDWQAVLRAPARREAEVRAGGARSVGRVFECGDDRLIVV